jgi:hypothetical protein
MVNSVVMTALDALLQQQRMGLVGQGVAQHAVCSRERRQQAVAATCCCQQCCGGLHLSVACLTADKLWFV